MTRLLRLSPEVAGGWGPATIVSNRSEIESGKSRVPVVEFLEYRFEGWLGDELLESFPCFIVTEALARDLTTSGMTGFRLGDVEVSVSPHFEETNPGRVVPAFRRLHIDGRVRQSNGVRWSGQDICLTEKAELVVSERCWVIVHRYESANCEAEELFAELDPSIGKGGA